MIINVDPAIAAVSSPVETMEAVAGNQAQQPGFAYGYSTPSHILAPNRLGYAGIGWALPIGDFEPPLRSRTFHFQERPFV